MSKSSIKKILVSIAGQYLNAREINKQQKLYNKFLGICEANNIDFSNAWRGARDIASKSISVNMIGTNNN